MHTFYIFSYLLKIYCKSYVKIAIFSTEWAQIQI